MLYTCNTSGVIMKSWEYLNANCMNVKYIVCKKITVSIHPAQTVKNWPHAICSRGWVNFEMNLIKNLTLFLDTIIKKHFSFICCPTYSFKILPVQLNFHDTVAMSLAFTSISQKSKPEACNSWTFFKFLFFDCKLSQIPLNVTCLGASKQISILVLTTNSHLPIFCFI